MEYYLAIFRYIVIFRFENKTETYADSEMTQLVKAENKEEARKACMEYWEKESNGAVLKELRINDTIIQK